MDFLGIGNIIESVGKVADDLFTSDEERLKMSLAEKQLDFEVTKLETDLIKGQQEITKIEAASSSKFKSWPRPALLWVCVFGFAYQFIAYPFLMWIVFTIRTFDLVSKAIPSPPVLDTGALMALATVMLGVGGMRSFDKVKKVVKG